MKNSCALTDIPHKVLGIIGYNQPGPARIEFRHVFVSEFACGEARHITPERPLLAISAATLQE